MSDFQSIIGKHLGATGAHMLLAASPDGTQDGWVSPQDILDLHDHDADYAGIVHNHDADYAGIVHNHDADYAGIAYEATIDDHITNHPSGGAADYVHLADLKASGVDGGSFSAGVWQVRDITVEVSDAAAICSLAGNQITLAAGTYRCQISCPCYQVGPTVARLYDVTGASVLLTGVNAYPHTTSTSQVRAWVWGEFILSVQSVLEIQHRATFSRTVAGLGVKHSLGDEIYTVAEFWRVSV